MTELSPIKSRIVEAIKAAGPKGIVRAELIRAVYEGRVVSDSAVRSNINQINHLIAPTGFVIRSRRGAWENAYVMERTHEARHRR